jgi:hypothetical protein
MPYVFKLIAAYCLLRVRDKAYVLSRVASKPNIHIPTLRRILFVQQPQQNNNKAIILQHHIIHQWDKQESVYLDKSLQH